jgi:cell filamentation protein
MSTTYSPASSTELQPGSRDRVLKNLLGIPRVREMEDAELRAYMDAERVLLRRFDSRHRFTATDVDEIHRVFLGRIYEWAGSHRQVNLSKGGFPFASAHALASLMREFERDTLAVATPCQSNDIGEVARRIATVHVELLLIHPYRDGNGRTPRLLATLMAYQAGFPGIDFSFIGSRGRMFGRYVEAIHAGLDRNYSPMQAIVLKALTRARRLASPA